MKNQSKKTKTVQKARKPKFNISRENALWVATILAFLLLGITVAGMATEGFTTGDPYGWFSKDEQNEVINTPTSEVENEESE